MARLINIVFQGDEPNLRFVETEDLDGHGVGVGKWVELGNGYCALQVALAEEAS